MQRGDEFRRWILAGLAGMLAWGILAWWRPSDDVRYSVCLTRRLSGFSCPGCGFTRASAHLAKGEVAESLQMHPLAIVVAAEAILIWVVWGFLLAKGRRTPLGWINPWLVAHGALFIGVWLVRIAGGMLPP